jgi:chloramphenicol 3-O phosphotransferase
LLNGASSSGKSSIGRALLPLLPDPWFFVPADAIGAMRSTVHTRVLDDGALASAGNDVIMDYPLSERWRLEDLLDVLRGYDVTLVEVRCAPEELERRERERGDRPVGLARSQAEVYGHGDFDIAVDTTNTGPETCAETIAKALGEIETPKAFDRLRARIRT